MLSTPLICCSIGAATDFSRVSASAPVYVAWTRISGGAMFGYSEIGSPSTATTPRRTVRIETTIATMGRLTKNRVTGSGRTGYFAGGFVGAGAEPGAVGAGAGGAIGSAGARPGAVLSVGRGPLSARRPLPLPPRVSCPPPGPAIARVHSAAAPPHAPPRPAHV